MFAFSFIRRHIFKLPCSKNSYGLISESGLGYWYRPFRMEEIPIKCFMCGVDYHSESDRIQHLQGKRHKSNYDKDLGVFHKSVEVHWETGLLNSAVLKAYISKFGKIESIHCNDYRKNALVYFYNNYGVRNILRREDHSVNGISLKINNRTSVRPRSASNKHKTSVDENAEKIKLHTELKTRLYEVDTLSEQMKVIKGTLRLGPDQIQERENVAQSLTELFRIYIPACTVRLFGSSVNGFGVKGGDIDMFLDLHEEEIKKEDQTVYRVSRRLLNNIPSVKWDSDGFNFYDLSLKEKILFTRNVLRCESSFSQSVFGLTSARCPVVKFKHVPSGLECDVSINNRVALRNTKLLTLFGSLDERVKDLVYTVRYWGKMHNLTGLPNKLSSYALTSMVIYFLQNTNPPVLPSLPTLKSLTDDEVIINGWDCSFVDDMSVIPKTNNTDTSGQLFKKFFDFHKKMAFSKVVLKCNESKAVSVEEFLGEMKYHPNPDLWKFRFAEINMQDPFVLEHNITMSMSHEKKVKFQMCLNDSSRKIEEYLNSNLEKLALFNVLDDDKNTKADTGLSFPIDLKNQQEVTYIDNAQMSDYIKCAQACTFLEKLFSEILHMEVNLEQNIISLTEFQIRTGGATTETNRKCTEPETKVEANESFAGQVLEDFDQIIEKQNKRTLLDTKERSVKRKRIDVETLLTSGHFENVPSIDLGKVVLNCHSENIPLTGRNKIKQEIQMEQVLQDLKLEKEISKRIFERGAQYQMKLSFKCILKPSISPTHTKVIVSFEHPTDSKQMTQFEFLYDFLHAYILKMFQKDAYNTME